MPRDQPSANLSGMRLHSARRHGRQQRSLERIEEPLVESSPRLASMFAIFTIMTRYEPMPATERLATRRTRLLRKASGLLSTTSFPSSY
jgi:hypothetical protein